MAYKNWTAQEETLLRQLVSEGRYSYREMATRYFEGRSIASLTCHARQYLDILNDKYEQRKYSYDEHFFDAPNVLNTYVAGFLAADGCIQYPEKQSPTMLAEVIDSDVDHLNSIKNALRYTGVTLMHPTEGKRTVRFRMSVSEHYAKMLATNFGIVPRKSNHLLPPNLATLELRIAYLLGLIDGDGCVHIAPQNNQLSISFVSSSPNAVLWYKAVMDELNLPGARKNKEVKPRKLSHCEAYGITYAGGRAVAFIKLIQSLYKVYNLPILTRKWDNPKINAYIQSFESKYPTFAYQPPKFGV